MDKRAAKLIEQLGLEPHPEGGFYREVYRSADLVSLPDGRLNRAALTTIYFLLPASSHSRWHQVLSDEVWHLYEGGPLDLFELDADGSQLVSHTLSGDLSGDVHYVHTVAARKWQAASTRDCYALVGCTVAPGFDFAEFRMLSDFPELVTRMRAAWPQVATLI